jgi:peptide/nickel transport system permease protein
MSTGPSQIVAVAGVRSRLNPVTIAALAVMALFIVLAILGNKAAPYPPNKINVTAKLEAASPAHWLGTDHLGRDVLSRIISGTSVAGLVAVSSIGLALIIGLPVGLLAAYGPRWLDAVLMLVVDTARSLPTIMVALALVTLVGGGLGTVIAVLTLVMAPTYARFARGQAMVLRSATFVEAQRALGAPPAAILGRHILPTMLGPMLVLASIDLPAAITFEAGMSFLGLGVRPPQASWGTIISDSLAYIREAPMLVVFATAPLVITTIAMTVLGERARDRLDPSRRST